MEEKIRTRLAALEQERDRFLQQANQQLAAYQAVIAELQALLAPEAPAEPAQAPAPGSEAKRVETEQPAA